MTNRAAKVLATVGCVPDTTEPAVSGNTLYVSCGGGKTVVAVDFSTGKVSKTYKIDRHISTNCQGNAPCVTNPAPNYIIVDNGLWLGWGDGGGSGDSGGSSDSGGSTLLVPDTRRIDLKSGKLTKEFKNTALVGHAAGSIWIANGDSVEFVNSSNGKHVGWMNDDAAGLVGGARSTVACGAIWDWKSDGTKLDRVDLKTGKRVWQEDIGPVNGVIEAGGVCWAAISRGGSFHLVRLGGSCPDVQTRDFPSVPFPLGNTFWTWDTAKPKGVRQVDLFTGARGRLWTVDANWLISVGGQVWANTGKKLVKLDITPRPIPASPTPTARACS